MPSRNDEGGSNKSSVEIRAKRGCKVKCGFRKSRLQADCTSQRYLTVQGLYMEDLILASSVACRNENTFRLNESGTLWERIECNCCDAKPSAGRLETR